MNNAGIGYPNFDTAVTNPQTYARQKKAVQEHAWQVQGFRFTISQGANDGLDINLGVSGRQILGISITSQQANASDLLNTEITFNVNSKNILVNASAIMMSGVYQQALPFMPVPYPLVGQDTIRANILKLDSGDITIRINVFYLPLKQFA